jgi:hypothetical protein
VNDIDAPACAAGVEALRPAYGRFSDRLEVVTADLLFAARPAAAGPRGLRQRAALWFSRNRWRYPFKVKGGWRGNRGWSIQQAMKLSVARHGDGSHLLILDTKNHFVRPVGFDAFVAADGRPRSFLMRQDGKFYDWLAGSFRLLGLEPPDRDRPTPPTWTPVVVRRNALLACLEAVEARVGPVEAFFARSNAPKSEFMLMHAHAAGPSGGWDTVYAPGLIPAATIARSTDAKDIDRLLSRVEAGEANILSIHASRLGSLDPEVRRRIEAIWRDRGLVAEGLLPTG